MMHCLKIVVGMATMAAASFAGPALACRTWVSTPGSAFEALEPLRAGAMSADDSPAQKKAALDKLAQLRAEVRPGDALSLLKAGYWAAVLHDIGITRDSDGAAMIRRAAELRPTDGEYAFFAALAYFETDKNEYRRHWARASSLAASGSAVARNLRDFEPELFARR